MQVENSTTCPNCGEPYLPATGPATQKDAKAMIENQLHDAGLCSGSLKKAFLAYERLFGHKFGEPKPDGVLSVS